MMLVALRRFLSPMERPLDPENQKSEFYVLKIEDVERNKVIE